MDSEGAVLQHQHGKARVRLSRVWRSSVSNSHSVVEWSISITLSSSCLPAFTNGDNSAIVATDTIKNTVYVIAKECKERLSMEDFGVLLGKHFVSTYPEVTNAKVVLIGKPWERVVVDESPHDHGFKLGTEKQTAEVYVTKEGQIKVASGIDGLSLLKTTQSGFEGFIRDKYTLLPETKERMMASAIRVVWSYATKPVSYNETYESIKTVLIRTFFGSPHTGVYSPSVQNTLYLMAKEVLHRFPEVQSVYLNMPNLHFLPVSIPSNFKFENDIYVPTDEPHGTIEACLTRKGLSAVSKL